jgi:hypothetical protein
MLMLEGGKERKGKGGRVVVVVDKHVFFKWQGEWLKEHENRRACRPS